MSLCVKKKKKVNFRPRSDERRASVDFKDTEDVRWGGGAAHSVESEGRACDGLQLGPTVQTQKARHLARLHEVESMRAGGGRCRIALYALQLLRPLALGHHIQLHIWSLLLVEQHLRRQRQTVILKSDLHVTRRVKLWERFQLCFVELVSAQTQN